MCSMYSTCSCINANCSTLQNGDLVEPVFVSMYRMFRVERVQHFNQKRNSKLELNSKEQMVAKPLEKKNNNTKTHTTHNMKLKSHRNSIINWMVLEIGLGCDMWNGMLSYCTVEHSFALSHVHAHAPSIGLPLWSLQITRVKGQARNSKWVNRHDIFWIGNR